MLFMQNIIRKGSGLKNAAKTFPAKKILPVLPRLTFSAVRRKRRRNFTKPVILV